MNELDICFKYQIGESDEEEEEAPLLCRAGPLNRVNGSDWRRMSPICNNVGTFALLSFVLRLLRVGLHGWLRPIHYFREL